MRLLSRSDVQQAITMHETIEMVRRAFTELSTGKAISPVRAAVPLEQHDGVTLFMPAYLTEAEALAVKIVSVHNRNSERELPRIHALVVLIDPQSGQPLAAMEGGYLTALRTGAASGVATDLLAHPDAEICAVFGAGRQARTQILAVAAVRPISRFLIYARNRESIEDLIAEMQPQMVSSKLLAAASPAEAVRKADVICAATTSQTPVFDGRDLKPGVHINGAGSFTHEMQEVDFVTLQRASKIIVDQREAALAEAGELIIAIEQGEIQPSDIYAEIGEIAAGLKAGREREDEITFFKSVGNAVQDAAVAQTIYQKALKENLGVEIDLFD